MTPERKSMPTDTLEISPAMKGTIEILLANFLDAYTQNLTRVMDLQTQQILGQIVQQEAVQVPLGMKEVSNAEAPAGSV